MDDQSNADPPVPSVPLPKTRGYQQEMLEESLRSNIIIALDTGSGKTHIAVLRMKIEAEREPKKISWFLAPTVALCEQQRSVIKNALPVSVGLVSGALEPDQWKNASLWRHVLNTHKIMVSTPQVLLDALRHGYIVMGRDISLLIFDEAHHAVDNDPYNRIMAEFYLKLPPRQITPPDSAATPLGSGAGSVLVRPMVLGLTASPIFGGNVVKAFATIERNLDSVIRAPQIHREELETFVHRPTFKHVLYSGPNPSDPPFSTNLAALEAVIATMNIENDPYVISLRQQLAKVPQYTEDWTRIDQKLSKTILKQNSFTHRGLRDFARSATDICESLGAWAADWYVGKVLEQGRRAANPYDNLIPNWKDKEKVYLLTHLDKVIVSPVSYYPDDVLDDSSDKVRALVECLVAEKANAESQNESYSGLVFVTRRDAVLALAALLSHHPLTAGLFRIGCLLGSSDSARRHSFLDITKALLTQSQEETLMDFRIGEKNLIISTSVAEEGIDIQACGSVIRWDPPQNMASWAQSRGRARRKRSTFTLMFEDGGAQQKDVAEWERLEREMVALYNDSRRELISTVLDDDTPLEEDEEEELEFRVESTGALLTLHSAVAHVEHFCSVMPNTSHIDHRPLYDVDPPEMPIGWHSFENRSTSLVRPYEGPFGSKLTLPRLLPRELRFFEVGQEYPTKISAHRHAAFNAYRALYEAGLLNDHLLPLTSVVEPHLEETVKDLLKEVEKRSGTASVSLQMDPWAPKEGSNLWWSSELVIDGLPPLRIFTRSQPTPWTAEDAPVLYRPNHEPVKVNLRPLGTLGLFDEQIDKARQYTRRLFWGINGTRMLWEDLDFVYLFLPSDDIDDAHWDARRLWLTELNISLERSTADAFFADAELFGNHFSFPNDLAIVRNGPQFAKAFRFLRWRFDPMSEEDEEEFRTRYARFPDLVITYPLLVVQQIPPRTNFLLPLPPSSKPRTEEKSFLLLPRLSTATLLSRTDIQYAFLLPSILRFLAMSMTVHSLRDTLFSGSPLHAIPLKLLTVAITTPLSQERYNYERLETLGDTVLKFVVGIQLLAEYPLWHEGYLSRKKDHAVSNVRLAKDAIAKELYRWIIRDRLVGKKWKPSYFKVPSDASPPEDVTISESAPRPEDKNADKKKSNKNSQQLSTKVLADVVESLIGAAYLHGGFDLGLECAKLFGLGLVWDTLPNRIETMLSRVHPHDDLPSQITDVERMLGYTFQRKLLLIEALTHASYQESLHTTSYERMEFLGDSVLDMVVTRYLYDAPGKEYSPGHIFLRKSAMVNAHLLAFICLRTYLDINTEMPRSDGAGRVSLKTDKQQVYLWQCLLHSSHRVLDDQTNTFARYRRGRDEIEDALHNGSIFPWAALLRLQAPKFLSDLIESLLGAVYLDSCGNLDTARDVLRKLGIMQIMEHIVQDNVDVLHPISRMSLWSQKLGKNLEYKIEKEKGDVCCIVLVDGEEEVRIKARHRGRASQEEVKFLAAEEVIKKLRLRDAGINKTVLQKKRSQKKKKI